MRILIVNTGRIPVTLYGGTERVIWDLGKELYHMGHQVSYLVHEGSHCDFAEVQYIDKSKSILSQIDSSKYDIVHFNFKPEDIETYDHPYIITIHGNPGSEEIFPRNTVFVSKNHAQRHNATAFVHNGLDWDQYLKPDFNNPRKHFHFLGNAAWRVKNVQGAIDIIKATQKEKLIVMGGVRFNVNMGLRFTFTPRAIFKGMIGGQEKCLLLNQSKGLIFPVKWHEPFGLSIIESLYYGAPVFGTPYGSLPEIVTSSFGYLSNKQSELVTALEHIQEYDARRCHEYATDIYNAHNMANKYLAYYEQVLNGIQLNNDNPQKLPTEEGKYLPWFR